MHTVLMCAEVDYVSVVDHMAPGFLLSVLTACAGAGNSGLRARSVGWGADILGLTRSSYNFSSV